MDFLSITKHVYSAYMLSCCQVQNGVSKLVKYSNYFIEVIIYENEIPTRNSYRHSRSSLWILRKNLFINIVLFYLRIRTQIFIIVFIYCYYC